MSVSMPSGKLRAEQLVELLRRLRQAGQNALERGQQIALQIRRCGPRLEGIDVLQQFHPRLAERASARQFLDDAYPLDAHQQQVVAAVGQLLMRRHVAQAGVLAQLGGRLS